MARIWHSKISSSTIRDRFQNPETCETNISRRLQQSNISTGYRIHVYDTFHSIVLPFGLRPGLLASGCVALEVGIGTIALLGKIQAALVTRQGGLAATEEAVRLRPRLASADVVGKCWDGGARCRLGRGKRNIGRKITKREPEKQLN